MSGIEVFQPGGTGDQNVAGATSPGTLQVIVGVAVYPRLVGVADQPATWTISTKPTGSTAAFSPVSRPGFVYQREFSPDKVGVYVLQVTGQDAIVYSVTLLSVISVVVTTAGYLLATQFGVKADGRKITDGVLTAGSNVLTSASAAFTQSDVGKLVVIRSPTSPAPNGTATISTAGPPYQITGSSTLFNTDIANTGGAPNAGGAVYVDGDYFTISNVNTDTSLSVNQPASHNTSGKTLYRETQIATTIQSVTDATHCVLAVTPQTIVVSGTSILATIASDDTSATDAAITSAFSVSSPELIFPPGIVGLTSNLLYTGKSTLMIRGAGKDKTFFTRMRIASENPAPTGNGYGMFSFDTCTGITLRDVSFDGSVPVMGMSLTTIGSHAQKAVAIFDSPDFTIEDFGSGGFGTRDEFIYANPNVDPTKTANLRIENGTILTSYVALNPATRSNMIVRGNRCVFGAVGLELQATSAVISGNSFQLYNVGGYATGGQFAIIDPITGCNYLITGNVFGPGNISTAGNAAVAVDGVTSATGCVVTLTGNTYVGIDGYFYNADSAIVRVANGCKGTVNIFGETFDRNTAAASGGVFVGIDGANTENVTVGPCKFRGRAGSNMTRGILAKSDVPANTLNILPGSTFGESVTTRWSVTNALVSQFFIGQALPGTDLGDTSPTLTVAGGNRYVLPEKTLTNNRSATLGTAGATTGEVIEIERRDVENFTYAVINGGGGAGTKYTFPVSTKRKARFTYDGTNWALTEHVKIDG